MSKRPSAKIIALPIRQRLICSACGADGEGTCRCGAPYVAPSERAAAAIAAHPELSDRAIAEELGVGDRTVNRARHARHARPSTAPNDAVEERRTGKDGRTRKVPKPKRIKPKKHKATDVSSGSVHQQVTRLYMELKNFSNDYCARVELWCKERQSLDEQSKLGLIEVLEDTAMSLQRLAQAIDDR